MRAVDVLLNAAKWGSTMNGDGLFNQLIHDDSGQGITEYGAILAFIALLIVLVLGFAQGSTATALQNCYSTIVSTMDTLNSQAS